MVTVSELTKYRKAFIFERPALDIPKLEKLEKKFGKYMYVPLDVPPIRPLDPEAFRTWYFENAKQIRKIKADVAGSTQYDGPTFYSIDSPYHRRGGTIWERNPVDMLARFPEIGIGLKELPFDSSPDYMLWSSMRMVRPHRDEGPWFDLPCSFRVVLYDSNPAPTLFLQEDMPGAKSHPAWRKLQYSPESNVFAWNNLRTKHGSTHNPENTKVLMILGQGYFNLDKYEALVERSIERFKDCLLVSKYDTTDFVEV